MRTSHPLTLQKSHYVHVIESLSLRSLLERNFNTELVALRLALIVRTLGSILTGIVPQFWVAWASQAARLLIASMT